MPWTLSDRTVIVTGATSGIGRATATMLASAGARVTITSRDDRRGRQVAAEITEVVGVPVDVLEVDLADADSVRRAAGRFTAGNGDLAVLVNNAGAVFGRRRFTVDGIERTLAVNHVGPFILTGELMPLLLASAPARIINVASSAHGWAKEGFRFDEPDLGRRYRTSEAYGESKLANILHARSLAHRHGSRGIRAYSVHPGLVRTRIGRDGDAWMAAVAYRMLGWRMLSPEEGADTIVWLATTGEPPEPNGGYFERRGEARSTRLARDDEAAERLWTWTEDLTRREAST
jgi:NAD(P)-dependent dehydrogenase (short-subunit alcohol dehydrogenase family)